TLGQEAGIFEKASEISRSFIGREGIDNRGQKNHRTKHPQPGEIGMGQIPTHLHDVRGFEDNSHQSAGKEEAGLPAPEQQSRTQKQWWRFLIHLSRVRLASILPDSST